MVTYPLSDLMEAFLVRNKTTEYQTLHSVECMQMDSIKVDTCDFGPWLDTSLWYQTGLRFHAEASVQLQSGKRRYTP